MNVINCEQRTLEWYEARLGKPTASNFDKIVTCKGEPSKQRAKYMYKLAGEYVSGVMEDTYQNSAMVRGCELEDEARLSYELITGNEVSQVGFCDSGDYGASPDGLVGDGLVEIKCPSLAVHVEYLVNGKLPTTYFQQVHGQLYVTGRDWCDFVSYHPNLKPLIVRVERDEKFIKKLSEELKVFCEELNELIQKIGGRDEVL